MEFILNPEVLVSLATLTALEIVLGIDNIIFIAILSARAPKGQQEKARKLGLMGALVSRLALLSLVSIIVKLDQEWFAVAGFSFSGKSLILLAGGLFLLYKSTKEIHHKVEGVTEVDPSQSIHQPLWTVVAQITLLDIVFSIDSVITAVGLTPHIWIMVTANLVALALMLLAANSISDFVSRHPSIKILALSFLLMIGLVLMVEGLGIHIPKGYIYFAMGFSVLVEFLNLRARSRQKKRTI